MQGEDGRGRPALALVPAADGPPLLNPDGTVRLLTLDDWRNRRNPVICLKGEGRRGWMGEDTDAMVERLEGRRDRIALVRGDGKGSPAALYADAPEADDDARASAEAPIVVPGCAGPVPEDWVPGFDPCPPAPDPGPGSALHPAFRTPFALGARQAFDPRSEARLGFWLGLRWAVLIEVAVCVIALAAVALLAG